MLYICIYELYNDAIYLYLGTVYLCWLQEKSPPLGKSPLPPKNVLIMLYICIYELYDYVIHLYL